MVRTHWGAVTTPHLFVLFFTNIDTVAAADDNNSNNKYDEG